MRLTVPSDRPPSMGFQVLQSSVTRKSPRDVAANPKISGSLCMAKPYQSRPGSLDWQAVQLDPSFRLKKAVPPATAVTAPSGEVSITPEPAPSICGVVFRHALDFGSRRKTPAREPAKMEDPPSDASRTATGAAGFGKSAQFCPPLLERNS